MAGVTRRDRVSSEQVVRRCGVGMLGDALLRRRLGWFGHVERRDERDALGRVWLVEVPGHQLPGRPKKYGGGVEHVSTVCGGGAR